MHSRFSSASRRARRRGASIVEFALVVPLLITLLLGILEFAFLSRNNLMLANAAREGTRTLALGHTTVAARARIKSVAATLNVRDSAISLVYSTDDGATYPLSVGDSTTGNTAPAGSLLKVALNYPHQSLTKFFPFLNNYRLKTNAAMRREGENTDFKGKTPTFMNPSFSRRRRGSVLVMVALSLTTLLGATALGTDDGLLVVDANRLQRGCDAAALAAATKLDDTGLITTNHHNATVEAQRVALKPSASRCDGWSCTTDVSFSGDERSVTVSSTVTRRFFFGAAIGVPTGQVRRKATACIKPVTSLSTVGPIHVTPIGISLETYLAYKNDQTNSHDINLVRQNKQTFGKDELVLFDLRDNNAKSGAKMQDQLTGQDNETATIGDYETTLNAPGPSERGKFIGGLDTPFQAATLPPCNDPFAQGTQANAIVGGTASRLNPRVVYLVVTPSTSAPNNGTFNTQILGFVPVYIEDYDDGSSSKAKGKSSNGDFWVTMRFLPPTSASDAGLSTANDGSAAITGLTSVGLTD